MGKRTKTDGHPAIAVEAEIREQPITETIETNYMPYVMSVIISRAIPEIDGFKPSHRKLLYTMYKMGLLSGARTKSANVVGQTMHLNPHGDASIYETLVRLTRGHGALLHPFVDSKGSFGKQYSRDMAYAASRYTEVKLDPICNELFSGIDKNSVEFVPNYDNTTEEPLLLPTTFPNILVSPNLGIAVGMACSICSFNLAEICDGTIAILRNPDVSIEKILDIIKAPDFSGGGILVYRREQMRELYANGTGSIRLRARYQYDKESNAIDVLQIPYSTSIEAIIKKITDLIKDGRLREITDIRDAIDLNGFRLTLDLRRGTDPDRLMEKLFALTPLEDTFDCNFNILINGSPKQLGVVDILKEWILFRIGCIRREMTFDLDRKKDKLHLLLGLGSILLDIDKAIRIIRNTEDEKMVVPNLMEAFSLSEKQADFIAEIKLRHLNREYIRNRVAEIADLEKEIADLEETIRDDLKIRSKIAAQLTAIKKKYPSPRRTQIIAESELSKPDPSLFIDDYPVRLVLTEQGYFKKLPPVAGRNEEQKLKDGDSVISTCEAGNADTVLILTNKAQAYPTLLAGFDLIRPSVLGDFLSAKLGMEKNEKPCAFLRLSPPDDAGSVTAVFDDGTAVQYDRAFFTGTQKKYKLLPAIKLPPLPVGGISAGEDGEIYLLTSADRCAAIPTNVCTVSDEAHLQINELIQLKRAEKVIGVLPTIPNDLPEPERYRKKKIPALPVPIHRT